MKRQEAHQAELRITPEEARSIASLLRYAISLNTTAGLVSPTQRRLATSTYRAVELAALVLEGKTFDEAVEESSKTWTGSLEEDHRRALELLERQRDTLKQAMSGRLSPEQPNTSRSPRTSSWNSSARTSRKKGTPKGRIVNSLTQEPVPTFAVAAEHGRILLYVYCT